MMSLLSVQQRENVFFDLLGLLHFPKSKKQVRMFTTEHPRVVFSQTPVDKTRRSDGEGSRFPPYHISFMKYSRIEQQL